MAPLLDDTTDITVGPDGNLWFTENLNGPKEGGRIGRITPAGVITEFCCVQKHLSGGITAGPDGNLWFTELEAFLDPGDTNYSYRIGRITPVGVITEFKFYTSIAGDAGNMNLWGITAGPDGNLWFVENAASSPVAAIGRITPAGIVTEFQQPSLIGYPYPISITTGPDGNLWFTESAGGIGRITPAGMITEFPLTSSGYPWNITAGPDGNLWFTDIYNLGSIGKVNIRRYNLCMLYDPTKAVKSEATIPIKLELCDASSNDLSSSAITLHAISVTQTSASISGQVQDSGNANPDSDFRFDATLGMTGGYIFNLKTTGLTTGTYNLNFTATGDSTTYAASFQVK
jgi:streptogramin lyase